MGRVLSGRNADNLYRTFKEPNNVHWDKIMTASLMERLALSIDDVQCYETVRDLRWPEIREWPFCNSISIIKKGCED